MPINFKELLVLNRLDAEARACQACSCRPEASRPVPGIGRNTGIVFVGKNPGAKEDIEGKPFIGPSGNALTMFLNWIRLTRQDIYLTNLVLCHTMNDRDPTADEIKTCAKSFLLKYLETLHPYLVVTLGELPAKYVAGVPKLGEKHGDVLWNATLGCWTIPCYHPGAVLYKEAWREKLVFDAVHVARFLKNSDWWRLQAEQRREAARVTDLAQVSEPERAPHVPGSESADT